MGTESFTVRKQTGLISLTVSDLLNGLTKSEREMCKIQTSKLTGTVHHGNTRSQVSTGPLPVEKTPSRQSRTHISLKHNESQTQKRKRHEADVPSFFFFFFWLYNACLDTCVGQNKSCYLYHHHLDFDTQDGQSHDLSGCRVFGVVGEV